MKLKQVLLIILLIYVTAGCNKDNTVEPVIVKNQEWKYSSLTQPVPSWGSSTRLILPSLISQIKLGEIGGIGSFGSHQGGHPEGLNHVWIDIEKGIPIKSWADGKVTSIEKVGSEYFITIEYEDGLVGKHMEVETALVSVGQIVKAGDPICYGMNYASYQSAEFMLYDRNRNDGETTGSDASYVSPFDYLREDIKSSLEQTYVEKVIKPFFLNGKDAGNNHRMEPYLTNQIIFHKYHQNTLAGEWLLNSHWALGGYPDIVTLLDVDNEYYTGKVIMAADNVGNGQHMYDGTWDADTLTHHFNFISNKITYYGLYELIEKNERATLKIEFNTQNYPSSFSSNAAIYIERAPIPIIVDAERLGVL